MCFFPEMQCDDWGCLRQCPLWQAGLSFFLQSLGKKSTKSLNYCMANLQTTICSDNLKYDTIHVEMIKHVDYMIKKQEET